MKPIINYVGSKYKTIKYLKKYFPDKINNYYDVFLGGASVYFYIADNYEIKKKYINDLDKNLIKTFRCIKKNPKKLIKELNDLNKTENKTEKSFEKYIKKFNNNKMRCSLLIYFSKISFNSTLNYYIGNNKIKPGYSKHNSKKKIVDKKTIFKANELLNNNTILSNKDYVDFIKKYNPKKGDFVFFDPPYLVDSVRQFYKNIFTINNFKELKKICDKLDSKGVNFMITLNNKKVLKELFSNYNIYYYKKNSSISQGKYIEKEMIITNY